MRAFIKEFLGHALDSIYEGLDGTGSEDGIFSFRVENGINTRCGGKCLDGKIEGGENVFLSGTERYGTIRRYMSGIRRYMCGR